MKEKIIFETNTSSEVTGDNKAAEKELALMTETEGIIPDDIEDLIKMAQSQLDKALTGEQVRELLSAREKFEGERKYILKLAENASIDPEHIKRALEKKSAPDYETDFYQELSSQKIISAKEEETVKKIQNLFEQFNKKENPTDQDEITKEKLKSALEEIDAKASAALVEKREQVKEKWNSRLMEQAESLRLLDEEIRKIPEVKDAIARAEESKKKIIAEKAQEAQKAKEEAEKHRWDQITRYTNNLSQRNKNALKRISEIIGEEQIEELRKSLREGGAKKQSAFNTAWNNFEQRIIEGKDTVRNASEVLPWAKPPVKKASSFPIHYGDALRFLQENDAFLEKIAKGSDSEKTDKAKKILGDIKSIVEDNQLIFNLIGSLMEKDKKTDGRLLRTIKTREQHDKEGITKKILEERSKLELEKKEGEKAVQEIAQEGGLVVIGPVSKDAGGYILQFEGIGGFLLEPFTEAETITGETRANRRKINKGEKEIVSTGWIVKKIAGYNFGVQEGTKFDKDFTSAPSLFKKAAKSWFWVSQHKK